MNGLKIEFPVAAFLTAALYLNAYFYQVGVLAFYGYPNITDSLNISNVIEGVVPGLLFYVLSLFVYLILSFFKRQNKVIYFVLMTLPLILFLYWMHEVNVFLDEVGIKRYREHISILMLILSFYSSMLSYSNLRGGECLEAKFKYSFALLTLFSMICSGASLGRMSSYYLGDVYKVDGVKSAYVLKVLSDKMIIADCEPPVIKYFLESDLSKIKMVRLSTDNDKKDFRECLFKSI